MRTLKFNKIFLLSQVERRATSVEFDSGATVLQAGNGFGKSALLKSLYDTFGAEPHRIDDSWRNANVASLVDFEIDGKSMSMMKFAGTYTAFDSEGVRAFQGNSITQELAPYLSEVLDFRLLMTDQREKVLIPPPAYAFAPYYVDQDKSWSSAWEPFRGMYLPRSAATLTDYHSGLKPNDFYVAQAERDRLALSLRDAEGRHRGLTDALTQLREIAPETAVFFSLSDFQAETDALTNESARLYEQQANKRSELNDLTEVRAMWSAQITVTKAALAEIDDVFKSAAEHPIEVECPTCGEHYVNDIATRFHIAADAEALVAALQHAQHEQQRVDKHISTARTSMDEISASISRVQAVLSTRKDGVSLDEVIAAEGRNAAIRVLRDRLKEVEEEIGRIKVSMDGFSRDMKASQDRNRQKAIKDYFAAKLAEFSAELDVRVDATRIKSLSAATHARGSEGPRGLAAYYYAFLHTTHQFGSATFCPIVIDAPNQQGQDAVHLPAIISFLVKRRPKGAQLVLGTEEAVGIGASDAKIISVGKQKLQLLGDREFDAVSEHFRPYLAQLVA
ncbi:hypothetical protein P9272_23225 [Mesorhizobium sp. WSM4976]|uniref:hypothetical protein n=1 Tax=Mesorhizobium sp. WSM4976 TaxID=3038549 RepID=UPI002417F91F|nr:hypothetical protein [Mesorhizobium sp. WSM4976]MDG4896483.1 hypothetical protein [Mesorhizobium sp. WSM4976]